MTRDEAARVLARVDALMAQIAAALPEWGRDAVKAAAWSAAFHEEHGRAVRAVGVMFGRPVLVLAGGAVEVQWEQGPHPWPFRGVEALTVRAVLA